MNESVGSVKKQPTIKLKPAVRIQSGEVSYAKSSEEKLSEYIKYQSRRGSEFRFDNQQENMVDLKIENNRVGRKTPVPAVEVNDVEASKFKSKSVARPCRARNQIEFEN